MRAWVAIGLLVAVCGGCKARAAEPVPALKASELLDQYKTNEVGADQRYRGKRLRVVGRVAKVERSVLGDAVLQFKEGDIRAEMTRESEPAVGELRAGQATLLECTGRGMVLGVPMLGECRVVVSGKRDAGTADAG